MSQPSIKFMRGYFVYPVSSWTDHSLFPDIVTSRQTTDWFFDISLQALPEDGVTEEDFTQVLETFSRRLGTELRVVTSITGKYDVNIKYFSLKIK